MSEMFFIYLLSIKLICILLTIIFILISLFLIVGTLVAYCENNSTEKEKRNLLVFTIGSIIILMFSIFGSIIIPGQQTLLKMKNATHENTKCSEQTINRE